MDNDEARKRYEDMWERRKRVMNEIARKERRQREQALYDRRGGTILEKRVAGRGRHHRIHHEERHASAREHVGEATELVKKTGYGRRRPEVEELAAAVGLPAPPAPC